MTPPARKRPASATPHRHQAARSGFPLLLAAVVGTCILLSLTALPGRHPSPADPGDRPEAPLQPGLQTPQSPPRSGAPLSRVSPGRTRTDRIVVRLRAPEPNGSGSPRLEQLENRISRTARFAGLRIEPHFRQSPTDLERARQAGEARTGRPLPDLNLYRRIELPAGTSTDEANRLLEDLRRLDFVEYAFVEPVAEPASLEDLDPDTPRGAGTETGLTPDYRPLQLYLRDAPVGLGATDVARYPGARGARVRLIDIEGDWNWAHEDLPTPFFQYGSPLDGWQNHGTAVLGELVGSSNGKGVEGIVPDLEVGTVSFSDLGVAAAIDLASSVLEEGDIILIELHAPGPNAPHGGGQFGYVPMEYWQDVFDAIRVATANGRIVVEAAGNGQQDLDDPVYGGLFDRQIRDSGAVLVAAGTPLGLTAEWFTNYGSRIDLHGWGTSIATTGYGTLHGGDQNRWYTSGFGGTSGASPMVCGAIASLQGMARASFGVGLDRDLAVELLRSSGSAFTGTKAIGPRPNLVAAREALVRGAAELHGVIRDAGSGALLPDLPILIDGERWVRTDSHGSYHAAVLPGLHTVRASGFWHEPSVHEIDTGRRKRRLDVSLIPRPLGSVSGVVSFDGVPVADAPIELRGTALSGRTSADGSYAIGAVPVDRYLVCAGPVPGSGTAWSWVSTSPTDVALPLELCPAQTFEDGAAEYTADPGWSLGTPSRGPSAHSGTHVWGTGLHGDYGSTLRIALTSPELTLGAATSIHLSFSQWYRIESAWDGGQVQVWDGVEWKIVEPIGGYPMQALSGLNWGPGYSGASDGWEPALFDLSAEARDGLRIRFVFGSDESITDLGWYLDDIAIETDLAPTAAPEADAATNGLDAVLSGGFPNPFRTSTHLRCRIPEAGVYGLTIHDPNGRVVRTLLNAPLTAGRSEVVWNGDDDQGRSVPAGVYYARLAHQGRVVGACSLLRIR